MLVVAHLWCLHGGRGGGNDILENNNNPTSYKKLSPEVLYPFNMSFHTDQWAQYSDSYSIADVTDSVSHKGYSHSLPHKRTKLRLPFRRTWKHPKWLSSFHIFNLRRDAHVSDFFTQLSISWNWLTFVSFTLSFYCTQSCRLSHHNTCPTVSSSRLI